MQTDEQHGLLSRTHIAASQARLDTACLTMVTGLNELQAHADHISDSMRLFDQARAATYQQTLSMFLKNIAPDKLVLDHTPPQSSHTNHLFNEIHWSLPKSPPPLSQPSLVLRFSVFVGVVSFSYLATALSGLGVLTSGLMALGICAALAVWDVSRTKQTALTFRRNVATFEEQVENFSGRIATAIQKTSHIGPEALQAADLVKTTIAPFQQQMKMLMAHLRDGANLLVLTNQVVGMPILDADGGLLSDVVQQLHVYAAKTNKIPLHDGMERPCLDFEDDLVVTE